MECVRANVAPAIQQLGRRTQGCPTHRVAPDTHLLIPHPTHPARLLCRSLAHNNFSGSLPEAWGSEENSLAALYMLDLGFNQLSGTLPKSWGTRRYALSSLTSLVIAGEAWSYVFKAAGVVCVRTCFVYRDCEHECVPGDTAALAPSPSFYLHPATLS